MDNELAMLHEIKSISNCINQIEDEIIYLKVTLELEQKSLMRRKALLLEQIEHLEKLKKQDEEL